MVSWSGQIWDIRWKPVSKPVSDYRVVTSDSELRKVVKALCDEPRYALDTEFHRERSYWPRVALVQIAWAQNLVLIDPLRVSLAPLVDVMNSDAVAVLHAAAQDLEVLERETGTVPRVLFDTQIAAGFIGMSTPSLASLHEREMNLSLPKGNRLSDWLSRPLTTAQLDYAASDVRHLLEIQSSLVSQLNDLSRLSWAEAECELLRLRDRGGKDPWDAWRKVKEARQLKAEPLRVVRTLAAWREMRASEIDLPVRFVLSDVGIVAIAQARPSTISELGALRGVDSGLVKGAVGQSILAAIAQGKDSDWSPPKAARRSRRGPDLRPAVALVSAWVNQIASDSQLDPTLLATRADVEALVRGDDDARLATGWRAEVAGALLSHLVSGEASLAFENGSILLETRSGTAFS